MSIKSIKEKQLLVNLAKSFGQQVDPNIIKEVEEHHKFESNIRDSIRTNIFEDLSKALADLKQEADRVSIENNYPLPPSLDDLEHLILEEDNDLVQTQHEETTSKTTTSTLSDLASEAITASTKRDSFQQPDPLLVAPDINSIQKKIRYLEQWIAKISEAGPGGGAGNTIRLDYPVKIVYGDYTLTRNDYYVGVNVAARVNITIPDSIGFPGRKIVIKDESGRCSKFPIIVYGNVDNDPGGFILKINNGAIQMIYREGWRII